MAKVIWTEESLRWLNEIGNYIAKDNPVAAARVVEGIYDKVQLLTQHPRVGHRYLPVDDREVRILLYGHYRVFYEVTSDDRVVILGIFHAAIEVDRYFI